MTTWYVNTLQVLVVRWNSLLALEGTQTRPLYNILSTQIYKGLSLEIKKRKKCSMDTEQPAHTVLQLRQLLELINTTFSHRQATEYSPEGPTGDFLETGLHNQNHKKIITVRQTYILLLKEKSPHWTNARRGHRVSIGESYQLSYKDLHDKDF